MLWCYFDGKNEIEVALRAVVISWCDSGNILADVTLIAPLRKRPSHVCVLTVTFETTTYINSQEGEVALCASA